MDMGQRARELRAQGMTVRQVADKLGVPRMTAYRMIKSAPDGPAVSAGSAFSDDPILRLLTSADLAVLGPLVDELTGGVTAMTRYRCLSLPPSSQAGEAARELFKHGLGEPGWSRWVFADEPPVAPALGAGTVPRERLDDDESETW